jgi:hypothetical protein
VVSLILSNTMGPKKDNDSKVKKKSQAESSGAKKQIREEEKEEISRRQLPDVVMEGDSRSKQ